MNVVEPTSRRIRDLADVEALGRSVARMAEDLGFESRACHELVLVVSELGTNILRYAGEGTMRLSPLSATERVGLEIEGIDSGPGIADVALALTDGFSSGVGLGRGLGIVQRLSDTLDIETGPGGTRMTARRWRS